MGSVSVIRTFLSKTSGQALLSWTLGDPNCPWALIEPLLVVDFHILGTNMNAMQQMTQENFDRTFDQMLTQIVLEGSGIVWVRGSHNQEKE